LSQIRPSSDSNCARVLHSLQSLYISASSGSWRSKHHEPPDGDSPCKHVLCGVHPPGSGVECFRDGCRSDWPAGMNDLFRKVLDSSFQSWATESYCGSRFFGNAEHQGFSVRLGAFDGMVVCKTLQDTMCKTMFSFVSVSKKMWNDLGSRQHIEICTHDHTHMHTHARIHSMYAILLCALQIHAALYNTS